MRLLLTCDSCFATRRRMVLSMAGVPLAMSVVRPYPTLTTLVPTPRRSGAVTSGMVGVDASTPMMRSTAKS